MARRYSVQINGEQYLGNKAKNEVHDLDNEDSSGDGCQIDAIIASGREVMFTALAAAHASGYHNCPKCMGSSFLNQDLASSRSKAGR